MTVEQSLAESTVQRLRRMILSGDLPAGTHLQERAFADRLGVSRTPLREAIARLVNEGLVTREHRGVPMVNRISLTDFMEILHVRRLLECGAARQAAKVNSDPEIWLKFKGTLRNYLEGEHPTTNAHADFDYDLHMQIVRTAGSKLLTQMVGGLKLKTRIFDQGEIPERFVPGVHEHIAIIDAILAQVPDRAEEAMRLHIDHTREAILEHIHKLP